MTLIDQMIIFGKNMIGSVRYSMSYPARLGPLFRDCSSFVLACAISVGAVPKDYAGGTTETLYRLNGVYLEEVYSFADVRKGDIFIMGKEGASMGAAGHTGIFLSQDQILHCSYSANGVRVDKASSVLDCKRSSSERYFRYKKLAKTDIRFIKYEDHTVTIDTYISSRTAPFLKAKYYKHLRPGDKYHYTKVVECDGFRWLYFKNARGQEMYLPYRHTKSSRNFVIF